MLCFTSPTIKILLPREILVKIDSCTKLLSWYSSIAISINFSWYFFATVVGFFSKIVKAKCSISLKSIQFFSFFFSANNLPNSITKFTNFCRIGRIFSKSAKMVSEFWLISLLISSLIVFLMLSLVCFASSFRSKVTFLSVGHLLKWRFWILR